MFEKVYRAYGSPQQRTAGPARPKVFIVVSLSIVFLRSLNKPLHLKPE
jgi:hypothetical protein